VCADNAQAIEAALDRVIADLAAMRDRVRAADRGGVYDALERASRARRHLPARGARPEALTEVRVPVPDREGVLAELTSVAGDLGINIYDIEIAHSA
jgi:prephenate dehydrogenase